MAMGWPMCLPVHPRARGEQPGRYRSFSVFGGSSPRTRGTGLGAVDAGKGYRFIPAHAGNSSVMADGMESAAVHPRARGEQC